MYVCICHAVTEHQIRSEVHAGAGSLREVSARLGVATRCGKCGKCARRLIHETLNETWQESVVNALPVSA
jgi:bacterioferritin-associated ferredoxin